MGEKSSGFHTNMKVFLFSILVAAACAQRGAFLQELINGDLNPCGAGVRPTTCTCPDGTAAAMPSRNDVKERLKSRVLNSPNNPCGSGVSVSCTCGDGSTFTPGSIIDNKQCGERPGNPCGSGRPTCQCPDGQSFSPRELRTLLRELAQG